MSRDTVYVTRFSRTERAVHWIHASAFFALLGTGFVLYVPRLSAIIARRPLVKDIHVYTALAWITLLAIVVVLGDRRGLRRTLRELDLFDDDDRLWLRRKPRPQGRFNAGQKVIYWIVVLGGSAVAISGYLLMFPFYGTNIADMQVAQVVHGVVALLFAIVHEAPAPLHGGAAGPAVTAVESVLLRALEKRQGDRFATVSAFVRSLESAAVTSVATTSPAPARGGGSTAPAQAAVASPVARIADKGTRWLRPTRWAALDPALVLKTLHIRRTRDDALPRRRWWWLLVVLPALAAAAFWTLTTRLPVTGVAPDRASAIGAPVPAATIKAARPPRHR